jgi:choline dehydrogenase
MLVPRGKVTGGSSAINGGIFLRGVTEDFDAWAAMGNDVWSFANVLPFYCRVERDLDFGGECHGQDGPIPVRRWRLDEWLRPQTAFYDACLAAGFAESPDHNCPGASGIGAILLNAVDDVRWSTLLGYLNPARERSNLTIVANTMVERVVIEGGRAVAVLAQQGNERVRIDAGEIILSAEAIGSPHLLMLSGVGPADQLQRADVSVVLDLPGVGQNLRDHPARLHHVGAAVRLADGSQLAALPGRAALHGALLADAQRHADPDGVVRNSTSRSRRGWPDPGRHHAAAGAQPRRG